MLHAHHFPPLSPHQPAPAQALLNRLRNVQEAARLLRQGVRRDVPQADLAGLRQSVKDELVDLYHLAERIDLDMGLIAEAMCS